MCLCITALFVFLGLSLRIKKNKLKKYILGSGTTTLMISNEEMNDIIKIVQARKDSNILLKGVIKIIKMKQKNKKEDF